MHQEKTSVDVRSSSDSTASEDERYGSWPTLAYATQHGLAMYGGLIAPPVIVGTATGLSGERIVRLLTAGLFVSGLSTLLQTMGIWKRGSRLPVPGSLIVVIGILSLPIALTWMQGGAGAEDFGSLKNLGIAGFTFVVLVEFEVSRTSVFEGSLNLVIVAATLGIGILPQLAPEFWSQTPSWAGVVLHSGITAAAIIYIALNLFFKEWAGGSLRGHL